MNTRPIPITVTELAQLPSAEVILSYLEQHPQVEGVFSLLNGRTYQLIQEFELDDPVVVPPVYR